jgi:hypothetical protein
MKKIKNKIHTISNNHFFKYINYKSTISKENLNEIINNIKIIKNVLDKKNTGIFLFVNSTRF